MSGTEPSGRIMRNRAMFGDPIRSARKDMNMSQKELAAFLGVKASDLSNWETGKSAPDYEVLPALCCALGLSMAALFGVPEPPGVLPPEERRAAWLYEQLTAHDRKVIRAMVQALSDSGDARLRARCLRQFVTLRRNRAAMEAGETSPLLPGMAYEEVPVRLGGLTEKANEILFVSDQSMSPVFYEGNEVYLAYTSRIRVGEIGVFRVRGEVMIREYHKTFLHAFSPSWPDTPVLPDEDILLFGRVLGRADRSDFPDSTEAAMLRRIAWEKKHA